MKILLIDDEIDLGRLIMDALSETHHEVIFAADYDSGMDLAVSNDFDAIVLDRALGHGADGLQMLKTLRSKGDMTPVLLLSGLSGVQQRVEGLKAGANDYLCKPFALEELVARIDALCLPRKAQSFTPKLTAGDVEIDLLSREVTRAGQRIVLPPHEYKLLEFFMRRPGQIVTRQQMLKEIWKYNFDPGTAIIEVHLSRLRKKIDGPFSQTILHTIRNVGFVLRPAPRQDNNERQETTMRFKSQGEQTSASL